MLTAIEPLERGRSWFKTRLVYSPTRMRTTGDFLSLIALRSYWRAVGPLGSVGFIRDLAQVEALEKLKTGYDRV